MYMSAPGCEPLQAGVGTERIQQILAHVLHAQPLLDEGRRLRAQAPCIGALLRQHAPSEAVACGIARRRPTCTSVALIGGRQHLQCRGVSEGRSFGLSSSASATGGTDGS